MEGGGPAVEGYDWWEEGGADDREGEAGFGAGGRVWVGGFGGGLEADVDLVDQVVAEGYA